MTNNLQILNGIPVIIAVRRPKKLLGYSKNIEFFHFTILASEENLKDNVINREANVKNLSHREELTIEKAQKISGSELQLSKIVLLGCGALGSIIATMIIRNGFNKFVFVDNEKVEPHNLVRHALFADSIGKNKAEALKDVVNRLYKTSIEEPEIIESNILTHKTYLEIEKKFQDKSIILDTSASNSILFYLTTRVIPENINLLRCELSYKGNLGILYQEGFIRNPRIDDLIATCYSLYLEISFISDWLKFEKNFASDNKDEFIVGIGCNSETMILANEIINLHASVFTNYIKNIDVNKSNEGKILLSYIPSTNPIQHDIKYITVKKFEILKCANNSGWEIRLKDGISTKLLERLKKYYPKETGGVVIGLINYKTKVIHVTEIIDATKDSKFFRSRFVRGVKNLNKQIEGIKYNTGQILGYVGEWHTHPMDFKMYSGTDLTTIMRFKDIFDNLPDPIPVFILIITPTAIIPFVF